MSEMKRMADARMIEELRRLQADLAEAWVDRSLPEDWNGLASREPLPPVKERVTIRLDADMVRWFRKLGPGYGRRINAVLRIYWEALIAGRIKAHWDEDALAPPFLEYIERMAEMSAARRDRG